MAVLSQKYFKILCSSLLVWAVFGLSELSAQTGAELDAMYTKARNAAFAGDRATSLTILDELIAAKSDHFDGRLLKARVLSWDKQFEKASLECQSLNSEFPEAKPVFTLWSTIERWSGQPEIAKAVCMRGLSKFPGDRELILELSKAKSDFSEYEEAIELNDSSINKYNDALPEQKSKIAVLMQIDSIDDAHKILDSLIVLNPDDKELRVTRSKLKSKISQYDPALVELDTVFDMDSSFLPAHHLRTNLFLWKSDNDTAIWSAQEGLSLYHDDVPLQLMMAKAFLRLDSFPPCDSLVNEIITRDSLNYDAWSVGLNSQLAQQNYDSVLSATDKLEPEYPADPEFKKLRVLSFAGKKKYKKAIEELAASEEDADSLDVAGKVMYTKFHYWDRQTNKAMKLSERFIEQHPEEADLYYTKAIIHQSWYEKKKALATLDTAIALDTANTDLLDLRKDIEENMLLNYVAAYVGYDAFFNNINDAYGLTRVTAEYFRKIRRHSAIARLSFADRFGKQGIQFELDGYAVINDLFYVYLNGGISNEFLFPKYRWSVEPFVNLPLNFEASIGIRYMGYTGTNVTIYTGSIGNYPGNWWFSIRPFISSGDNGIAQSYVFRARRFFLSRFTFLELSLGGGANPDNSYLDQVYKQLYDSRSYNAGLTYQQSLSKHFYIKAWVLYEHYSPKQIPDFQILSLNGGLWWRF